ncbi:2Fe-2S iron-sulfur cluster-binding protein [Halocatena salina]|uniref:2Fe-2S iron-sulfur cluster-binding protein n=1 Tax=Halocatena salina TaxID=2934340 RepID=A0A8U0A7R5_9EURY|nr:2Fe-2S iron-sulfur cluster-binding protein [Halocatena salina]UPM45175.1 2Fe-2S iron-sulfur cluster-binding protein [Halocatena salina]
MDSDPIWDDAHDTTGTEPIWKKSRRVREGQVEINAVLATGTATDPDVTSDETTTITVDGQSITLEPSSTVLDGVAEADTNESVPALCSYQKDDRIGPRSACRTCMVESDEYGLIPSCSFPAREGMDIQTDTPTASETRDVNLDLVLGGHNLLCTTCGKNGRCELQEVSIENEVEHPRYGVVHDNEELEPIDESSPFIQIDRNKCILCNRCVEACNDVQVAGVLRMEGQAGDMRIGFQNGAETMMGSTCISCGHCVTVCPTGALVEQNLVEAATLPVPGFTHSNSVGKTMGEEYTSRPRRMTPMYTEEHTEAEPKIDEQTDSIWQYSDNE